LEQKQHRAKQARLGIETPSKIFVGGIDIKLSEDWQENGGKWARASARNSSSNASRRTKSFNHSPHLRHSAC